MSLVIHSIQNHGDQTKEIVFLKADTDLDLVNYMLADTTYVSSGQFSNRLRHMYWFAPKKIKAGSWVTLSTGHGTESEVENKDKSKTYHFFWGLGAPVWNDTGDCAVLLNIAGWKPQRAK